MLDLPKAAFLRLDTFPVDVAGVDLPVGDKRVVVTDKYVILLMTASTGPYVAYQGVLSDFSGTSRTGWTVEVETGDTLTITKATGCGCGSRLRSFRAYPGVGYRARG